MKPHGKFLKLINLKLDERLSDEDARRLDEHLDACDACRAEYEALAEIRGMLLSASAEPLDPETAGMQASKIMSLVRDKAKSGAVKKPNTALRPAIGLASVLVILIASVALLHPPDEKGRIIQLDPNDPFNESLVWVLNQHELVTNIDAFNEPTLVLGEILVNERSLDE